MLVVLAAKLSEITGDLPELFVPTVVFGNTGLIAQVELGGVIGQLGFPFVDHRDQNAAVGN